MTTTKPSRLSREIAEMAGAQRRRDRVIHSPAIGNAGQFDQADVMGERARQAAGDLDRQACLADATRPGERHQPDGAARQQIDQVRRDVGHLKQQKRDEPGDETNKIEYLGAEAELDQVTAKMPS